ncbi:hypothetical protein WMY93_007754 [Mugilogobius chulae]|uniref:Uncharacterized protein n=1 Tax=Mugilogobius chulae TaxID=88201 RepID=A0AAW0PDZ2_9GOBI
MRRGTKRGGKRRKKERRKKKKEERERARKRKNTKHNISLERKEKRECVEEQMFLNEPKSLTRIAKAACGSRARVRHPGLDCSQKLSSSRKSSIGPSQRQMSLSRLTPPASPTPPESAPPVYGAESPGDNLF